MAAREALIPVKKFLSMKQAIPRDFEAISASSLKNLEECQLRR
jgi:hypothetical protein